MTGQSYTMRDHLLLFLLLLYSTATQACYRDQSKYKSLVPSKSENGILPDRKHLPPQPGSPARDRSPLLNNSDFESPLDAGGWWCQGCSIGRSVLAYSGSYSGLVVPEERQDQVSIGQSVPISPGKKYYFNAMVQLQNTVPGYLWHKMQVQVALQYAGESHPRVTTVGTLPYLRAALGWQKVGGDFVVANKTLLHGAVSIQADSGAVKFRVDKTSLEEVVPDPQWRDKANERIDSSRKNNITFKFNISSDLDPSKAKLLVNLTQHDFPFGSAVSHTRMTDTSQPTSFKYRDFFFYLYNFAVLENSLKWPEMEHKEGHVDFETADAALKVLASKDVPVRGHCILWDVPSPSHQPSWLIPMNKSQVEAQVKRRMNYAVTHYRNKVVHWDVNNEQLHGAFFENKTGDPDFMTKAFHMAHNIDSDVHLFTNDYNLVAKGEFTQAYVFLAKRLVEQGAPIYGMGIQGHLIGEPDITLMKRRLDILSAVGLPMWVTELDVDIDNRDKRADGYEDVLRMYFSQPQIEGIMMWGFWDKCHWRPKAAIVEGDDFKLNAAGQRVVHLFKQEWSTNVAVQPQSRTDVKQVRAFHGQYNVTILYDGHTVASHSAYLHKGKDLDITVNINSDTLL